LAAERLAAGSFAAGIYSASKFAAHGITMAMRDALAKYNTGVSALCPANIRTNIAESVNRILIRPVQARGCHTEVHPGAAGDGQGQVRTGAEVTSGKDAQKSLWTQGAP